MNKLEVVAITEDYYMGFTLAFTGFIQRELSLREIEKSFPKIKHEDAFSNGIKAGLEKDFWVIKAQGLYPRWEKDRLEAAHHALTGE